MDCIFCRIAKGELPCKEVYRDEHVLAFQDIHPKAPVHTLVIPLEHIPDANGLLEVDPETAGRLFQAAARVARLEGVADRGYRIIVNCGPEGGQEVGHLHLHVLGGRPLGPMVCR